MKEIIAELEEQLRLAMLSSNVSELDKLISPDLLFTNHLGILVSKEDDLNAHKTGTFEFSSINLSDSQILPLVNTAVVSVKANIQGFYNGQSTNGIFRFTRTWSNISGTWQVVAGHSSIIA